ncbi:hypothetical protein L198_00716 [Cryptococcus wingfieldii CBS 7118]|uniref:Uncharacterized protein n=1 Tax=Cryptococcus wingfieldii CBS 7118 TaxID=1295528 RepID=A0A1E3K3N6_9TREE|nr:hypothetical protein L198_00716 [Cryptococcus wingfieldii CBS 7118]ODO07137.1 hypothetical protein L198_00716 [Cryptococcus wingfieldii CBS 7118]
MSAIFHGIEALHNFSLNIFIFTLLPTSWNLQRPTLPCCGAWFKISLLRKPVNEAGRGDGPVTVGQLVDPRPPVDPQASLPAPSPGGRQTRCGLLKGPVAQGTRKSQALRSRLQRVQLPRGLEAAKEGQAGT